MEKLSANWVTEHLVDFEYKKYILLAYLQHVEQNFNSNKLYPALSDLVQHHINLKKLKDEKLKVSNEWPKQLTKADIKNMRLHYETLFADDDTMQEIDNIITYSLPMIEKYLAEGRELYNFAEEHIRIEPVGIIPMLKDEGYLLLRTTSPANIHVYSFALSIYDNAYEQIRALKTHYISSYSFSVFNTYHSIKLQLIQRFKELPNPATYVIESSLALPVRETYLPLAKRILVQEIANR